MRTPSNHTGQTASPARSDSPITWPDLLHIQDTHGLRPVKHKTSRRSPEASAVHTMYEAWVTGQGIKPDRPYLMPLPAMVMMLQESYRWLPRNEAALTAHSILVDAINDPAGVLEVAPRPYQSSRRRAA